MNIIKRDGRVVEFDQQKIISAIEKAFAEVYGNPSRGKVTSVKIATAIRDIGANCSCPLTVEEIQDIVEEKLMDSYYKEVARAYVRFRYKKEIMRENNSTYDGILQLVNLQNEELKEENSNKNAAVASTQRDYMAGEISKDLSHRILLPKEVVEAHDAGEIHFHDMDYFAQKIINCALVNLDDMLQNGTVINKTLIEKPKSFMTACTVATQIMAIFASEQYGGQSISLTHLAPFVDISRQKIKKQVADEYVELTGHEPTSKEDYEKYLGIVEQRVKKEITNGVQTMQYQINTLNTSNGQTPFVSIFMYLGEAKDEQTKHDLALIIEEVLNQRYQGTKNEKGVWVTPAFPKLLYVLEEDNVHEDSPYWYLTQLAAKCTAKRLVPDYISEKIMKQHKIDDKGNGNCYPCMGCRSFLTPYLDENGKPKYYGRFNQGVVTINLVDVACSVSNLEEFWELFEKRLELCHLALQCRHERLTGTVSDIAPTHFQYGAIARLQKGETIDKLLHGNYSTLSLGYAGLWECVYKLIGKKLTEEDGKELGLQIMQKMNDKCAEWRAAEDIGYSLYGSPIETTTYRFATCLKKKFGEIEGVTDRNYITNSYHIHVTEPIDAFNKFRIESEFQLLSPGGMISYCEVPNLNSNLEAVEEVVKFIYDNIMYAELNTKSDFCQVCGYDGEIEIVEDDEGKLIWKCPNCGNTNQDKMNVARRTCGYIGSNFWNQGRTQEIKERVCHL